MIRYRRQFQPLAISCNAVVDPNAVDPAIRKFNRWRFPSLWPSIRGL